MQAKLLQIIETGAVRPVGGSRARVVDVRVVAAGRGIRRRSRRTCRQAPRDRGGDRRDRRQRRFDEALDEAAHTFHHSCVDAGITSLAGSERVLDLGADMVAVGRAGIIHPDWPRRLGDGGFAMREPPWPQAALREAAVGEAFVQYLLRFPGLVEGGAPPRS